MKPYRILAAVIALLLLAAAAQAGELPAAEAPESLTLEGETGGDLSFLSGSAALQTLTLIDCTATDLSPLASCKKLSSLTIRWSEGFSGVGAYDLAPLSQCARLKSLTLAGACVNDLEPLKKVKTLTALSVQALPVEDYTPIQSLGLKHLLLSGAPAEQVAAIFIKIGKNLESAVVADCALTVEANAAILKCAELVSLRFENVAGLETGADAWTRLTRLTSLSMDSCALQTLDFLSNFVSTVIVKLEDIEIGGVHCGAEFDKYFLKTDNVPSEALLDFLNGEGRRWLYAAIGTETGEVSAEVIEALAGIDSLLSLDVRGVAPGAFAEDLWEGFPRLKQLKFSSGGTASLEFLRQLNDLQRLVILNTDVTQSETIGAVPTLRQLTLIACGLDSWNFLGSLENLELLTAAGCNGPDSLTFTAGMPRLKALVLEDAPITGVSSIAGPELAFLSLYGCPIQDYAPLAGLPLLSLLSCGEGAKLPELSCRVRHLRYIDIYP